MPGDKRPQRKASGRNAQQNRAHYSKPKGGTEKATTTAAARSRSQQAHTKAWPVLSAAHPGKKDAKRKKGAGTKRKEGGPALKLRRATSKVKRWPSEKRLGADRGGEKQRNIGGGQGDGPILHNLCVSRGVDNMK